MNIQYLTYHEQLHVKASLYYNYYKTMLESHEQAYTLLKALFPYNPSLREANPSLLFENEDNFRHIPTKTLVHFWLDMGASARQAAVRTGVSQPTVARYKQQASPTFYIILDDEIKAQLEEFEKALALHNARLKSASVSIDFTF